MDGADRDVSGAAKMRELLRPHLRDRPVEKCEAKCPVSRLVPDDPAQDGTRQRMQGGVPGTAQERNRHRFTHAEEPNDRVRRSQ